MSAKTIVIAEIGVNHNGSVLEAKKLIDAAILAGADIVKFQTYISASLVGPDTGLTEYQATNLSNSKISQREMLLELELSREDHIELRRYCSKKGIEFLSSPFDPVSLEFLTGELEMQKIKLGSGEITNFPMIKKIAEREIELIMSTGMATLAEITEAVDFFAAMKLGMNPLSTRPLGFFQSLKAAEKDLISQHLVLMHCTSMYPCPNDCLNLNFITTLRETFNLRIGHSDHSIGIHTGSASVALGATHIEKHLTLDSQQKGPDHKASLEPREFAQMVESIRLTESQLGRANKLITETETSNRRLVRKGIYARTAIFAGDLFSYENLEIRRPENNVHPRAIFELLGKRSMYDIAKDGSIENV